MMDEFYKSGNRLTNVLIVSYFLVAMGEIVSELFFYTPLIVVFKPLMPIVLMVLYWFSSQRRHPLFFIAMLLSSMTNILFIPSNPNMLFFGIIVFMIHRIIVLVLIFKMVRVKDNIPVAIGTVPFMLVFFYMLASSDVPSNSFVLLIIQNILISIFGGIAVSNYMMNDDKKNSWLLICGMLFVALQFIVFVEKYYLIGFSPEILRPIAMGLNAFAFFTFYEFIMAMEKSNDNGSAIG
jgi:hypothetical protein